MTSIVHAALLAGGLFLGMLVFLELGRRWGLRELQHDPDGAREGSGAVEGAVYALMGLLIAFTFSGAAGRFDTRRVQIIDEANAIGTAWLRLDLLSDESQPALRDLFRKYVDSRIAAYRLLPDLGAARGELARSLDLQAQIWSRAVAITRTSPTLAPSTLLLPALNEMFDIAATRTASATLIHQPLLVYVMLFALALMSALFAGVSMAGHKRSWLHVIGYAAIMSASAYLILDLEFPRFGLITLHDMDQLLVDLRASFH